VILKLGLSQHMRALIAEELAEPVDSHFSLHSPSSIHHAQWLQVDRSHLAIFMYSGR
jgi:hypothetical protein